MRLEERLVLSAVAVVQPHAKKAAKAKGIAEQLKKARDLGTQGISPETLRAGGAVQGAKKSIYYRVQVGSTQVFTAATSTLKGNANLKLYDASGNLLASSSAPGKARDVVSATLAPGTYFLGVSGAGRGKTKYQLSTAAGGVAGTANTNNTGKGTTTDDGNGNPSGGSTPNKPPVVTDPAAYLHGTYVGTAKTTMNLLDPIYYTVTETGSIESSSTVLIRSPIVAQNAKQVESNPINLTITPTQASTQGKPGDLYIYSAGISLEGSLTKELMVEYLTVQLTNKGFEALLTDSQKDLAMAANQIFAPGYLVPSRPNLGIYNGFYTYYDARYGSGYQMGLTAEYASGQLTIKISGLAVMGANLAQFITTIVADRST